MERLNLFLNFLVLFFLVEIKDFLKFFYCGMYLDVVCYFFDKEFVKKYIFYFVMFKMNYFYWYFIED